MNTVSIIDSIKLNQTKLPLHGKENYGTSWSTTTSTTTNEKVEFQTNDMQDKTDIMSMKGAFTHKSNNSSLGIATTLSSQKEKCRKRVRFRMTCDGKEIFVNIFPIPKTTREKSKIWYTTRDYSAMIDQNNIVIKLMDMGYTDATMSQKYISVQHNRGNNTNKNKNTTDHCMTTRGLERQTKKGFSLYCDVRAISMNAVLEKQNDKRNYGDASILAEAIASSYQIATIYAKNTSIQNAIVDAKFANEYLQNCDVESIRRLQMLEKSSNVSTSSIQFRLFNRRRSDTIGQ